ncbi:MAG: zinc-binding dehydrogenase [Deltaproteobacteria bacterium]|nr:zinc-binding dehydrogenase [Deltaproteobacteria bacterium]
MRAILIERHGGPEVMEVREVPEPRPGPGEVRIRVAASGQNYADTLWRLGQYPGSDLPTVPGMEVAGTVDAVGQGVEWPRPGDSVAALLFHGGGYAEAAVAPAAHCVTLPDAWSLEQGAAFLLQHLTAWHALTTMGRAAPGEVCVVHAAAGGVGGAAVELARHLGLLVVATASTAEKRAMGLALGADAAADYEGFVDEVRRLGGADLVLESVGGHVVKRSLECLKPFGRLVVIGFAGRRPASISEADLVVGTRTVAGLHLSAVAGRAALFRPVAERLMHFVEEGKLSIRVGARFPLAEAARAHQLMESRASQGKILLLPATST